MNSILFEIVDYLVHILACAILCEIIHSVRNKSVKHIDEQRCCHHEFTSRKRSKKSFVRRFPARRFISYFPQE
jgi:hypothetical protein